MKKFFSMALALAMVAGMAPALSVSASVVYPDNDGVLDSNAQQNLVEGTKVDRYLPKEGANIPGPNGYWNSIDALNDAMEYSYTRFETALDEPIIGQGSGVEYFLDKFSGYIIPEEDGTYQFGSQYVDKNFYLEIGGQTVYEFWTGQWSTDRNDPYFYTDSIVLEAGKAYPITAAYYRNGGGMGLEMIAKKDDGAATALDGLFTFKCEGKSQDDIFLPDEVIDSEEAWNVFAANAPSYSGKTVRITEDLDFTGKKFVAVNLFNGTIDGGNHTLKGIRRTVENATGDMNNRGHYGLLVNTLSNNGIVRDLTLEDCSMTVTVDQAMDGYNYNTVYVGTVGYTDRALVQNITLKDVTFHVTGGRACVGTVVGHVAWAFVKDGAEIANDFGTVTIEECSIYAPNSIIGIVIGDAWDGLKGLNIEKVDASLKVLAGGNTVTDTTYVAALNSSIPLSVGQSNVDEIRHPGYIQFRDDGETFAARLVVDWDREELRNAKEVSMILTFGGSDPKEITVDHGTAYATVKAGEDTYKAWDNSALMGFTVTDIPDGSVDLVSATLVLDGVEIPLGSTDQIPY